MTTPFRTLFNCGALALAAAVTTGTTRSTW